MSKEPITPARLEEIRSALAKLDASRFPDTMARTVPLSMTSDLLVAVDKALESLAYLRATVTPSSDDPHVFEEDRSLLRDAFVRVQTHLGVPPPKE